MPINPEQQEFLNARIEPALQTISEYEGTNIGTKILYLKRAISQKIHDLVR